MNKYDGCSLDRTFCDTKECINMDCYHNPNYISNGSKWISFSQFKNTDECIGFKTFLVKNDEKIMEPNDALADDFMEDIRR